MIRLPCTAAASSSNGAVATAAEVVMMPPLGCVVEVVHTEGKERSVRTAFGARDRAMRSGERPERKDERLVLGGHARSAGAARHCRAPTPAVRRSAGAR